MKLVNSQTGVQIDIDQEWLNMIQYVQKNKFCELTITFRDGKPTKAESIKLGIRF